MIKIKINSKAIIEALHDNYALKYGNKTILQLNEMIGISNRMNLFFLRSINFL